MADWRSLLPGKGACSHARLHRTAYANPDASAIVGFRGTLGTMSDQAFRSSDFGQSGSRGCRR
jgi:hypothetical protein